MQILAMVNLMTFLVVALLLFLLVTPQDRHRAGSGDTYKQARPRDRK
jgi:hypothetical protein